MVIAGLVMEWVTSTDVWKCNKNINFWWWSTSRYWRNVWWWWVLWWWMGSVRLVKMFDNAAWHGAHNVVMIEVKNNFVKEGHTITLFLVSFYTHWTTNPHQHRSSLTTLGSYSNTWSTRVSEKLGRKTWNTRDPIYSLLRSTKLNGSLTKEARSGILDRRGEELHLIVWSIKAHPKGAAPLQTLKKQCKEFFYIHFFLFNSNIAT